MAIGISDSPAYVSMTMDPPFRLFGEEHHFPSPLGIDYFDGSMPKMSTAHLTFPPMAFQLEAVPASFAPGGIVQEEGKKGTNGTKDLLKRQLQKTQLCTFWKRNCCARGTSCTFAHSVEELKELPDLRRTSLCKQWLKGRCPQSADGCRYAHGEAYLRRTFEESSKRRGGLRGRRDPTPQDDVMLAMPPGISVNQSYGLVDMGASYQFRL